MKPTPPPYCMKDGNFQSSKCFRCSDIFVRQFPGEFYKISWHYWHGTSIWTQEIAFLHVLQLLKNYSSRSKTNWEGIIRVRCEKVIILSFRLRYSSEQRKKESLLQSIAVCYILWVLYHKQGQSANHRIQITVQIQSSDIWRRSGIKTRSHG